MIQYAALRGFVFRSPLPLFRVQAFRRAGGEPREENTVDGQKDQRTGLQAFGVETRLARWLGPAAWDSEFLCEPGGSADGVVAEQVNVREVLLGAAVHFDQRVI